MGEKIYEPHTIETLLERERERLSETGSENDTKFTGKMFKTFLYFFIFI